MGLSTRPDSRSQSFAEGGGDSANTLGQARMQTGDLDRAEKLVRQAFDLDPTTVQVVYNLALIFHYQGRLDATIRLLQTREDIDAHPPTARLLENRKRLKAPVR